MCGSCCCAWEMWMVFQTHVNSLKGYCVNVWSHEMANVLRKFVEI